MSAVDGLYRAGHTVNANEVSRKTELNGDNKVCSVMSAGDVLLLEAQTTYSTASGYVPIEAEQVVFDWRALTPPATAGLATPPTSTPLPSVARLVRLPS